LRHIGSCNLTQLLSRSTTWDVPLGLTSHLQVARLQPLSWAQILLRAFLIWDIFECRGILLEVDERRIHRHISWRDIPSFDRHRFNVIREVHSDRDSQLWGGLYQRGVHVDQLCLLAVLVAVVSHRIKRLRHGVIYWLIRGNCPVSWNFYFGHTCHRLHPWPRGPVNFDVDLWWFCILHVRRGIRLLSVGEGPRFFLACIIRSRGEVISRHFLQPLVQYLANWVKRWFLV
jgi:hypothetical protein